MQVREHRREEKREKNMDGMNSSPSRKQASEGRATGSPSYLKNQKLNHKLQKKSQKLYHKHTESQCDFLYSELHKNDKFDSLEL